MMIATIQAGSSVRAPAASTPSVALIGESATSRQGPARHYVCDGALVVAADRVSVRWAHEGSPKEGELILSGPAPSCRGDFTDTFHAAAGLVLHGHIQGSTALLYGTYPAGDGSPDWGWRIVLDWCDPDHFCLRMFNVLPDGTDALAVDLYGSRAI